MSNSFFYTIEESFLKYGLLIKPFSNAEWDEFINTQEYIPVLYSSAFNEYQLAYFKELNYDNFSVQIYSLGDKKLIGVWPIFYRRLYNGKLVLETFGSALAAPFISSNIDFNSRKNHYKNCFLTLKYLCEQNIVEVKTFTSYNYLSHELDPWQLLLEFSGNMSLKMTQFESVLNLSLSLDEIKMRIRKSYKSLINKGFKLWNIVEVMDHFDDRFNEFKELHLEVSGRKTRSDESWNVQLNNLKKGNAKLICAYNAENKLVGGAFFDVTPHEANYSVGVYDRKLFDLPIAHAIQWKAIEMFKESGLLKYKIGIIHRNDSLNSISEKEFSISTFKAGFGGDLFSITVNENKY